MRLLQTLLSIHRTIKVRPTKYFFLLLGAIVSLFLQAYMHNYNIVYIMMFCITAVAGTSTLYGMFNLHPLQVAFLSAERFFASQDSLCTLRLHNGGEYPCYDLDLHFRAHAKHIALLAPKESVALSFSARFEKRGAAQLEEASVTSYFPFAHEIKSKRFPLAHKILVYPKPSGESLFDRFAKELHMHGDFSDFDTVSRFAQGENIGAIHWASLAKNDTLMSKRFLYEQRRNTLHFDFKTLRGESEERLSQLCLWVLECEKHAFAFTLALGGEILDSKKVDTDAILAKLALY